MLGAAIGATLMSAIIVILIFIAAFTMFSRSRDFAEKFLSSLMFFVGVIAICTFPALLWNLWQAALRGS